MVVANYWMLVTDAIELAAICLTIGVVLHEQYCLRRAAYSTRIALQLVLMLTQAVFFVTKDIIKVKNDLIGMDPEDYSSLVWFGYGLA